MKPSNPLHNSYLGPKTLIGTILGIGLYRLYHFLFLQPQHLTDPYFLYDLKNYLWAAQNLTQPETIYHPQRLHPYKYPPFFLLPLSLLTQFPLPWAAAIFWATSVLAFALSIALALQLAKNQTPTIYFWLAFLLLYDYWRVSLRLGQVQSFWFLAIMGAVYLEKQKHYTLAGISLALGAQIKIIPLLFLGYFLSRKSWKVLLGFLLGIALSTLTLGICWGWPLTLQLHISFTKLILLQSTQLNTLETLHYKNHSLLKVLIAPLANQPYTYNQWQWNIASLPLNFLKIYAYSLALLLLGYTTWLSHHHPHLRLFSIAQFTLLCLLLPPIVWHDYYYLLILPLAVAFQKNKTLNFKSISFWIFALLFLAMPRLFHHFGGERFYWFLGGETLGLLALWWNLTQFYKIPSPNSNPDEKNPTKAQKSSPTPPSTPPDSQIDPPASSASTA
ncbi:MAG: DUF2029 domain-containing protein [Planctomycetota bacterium]|nr:MAG: DUF2029 domain-containing protein [Planctomycetota bacterium]